MGQNQKRVLVVDDERMIRRLLRRILSTCNCEVVQAENGDEALEHLSSGTHFDVILCDLTMPGGKSGREVYDEVAQKWPEITERFVFVTGGAFRDEDRDFLARIPNRTLQKPFTIDTVQSLVKDD